MVFHPFCLGRNILYMKNPLNIRFTESALEEGSEEDKELCKNVKRVMEIIVGLLMDR